MSDHPPNVPYLPVWYRRFESFQLTKVSFNQGADLGELMYGESP